MTCAMHRWLVPIIGSALVAWLDAADGTGAINRDGKADVAPSGSNGWLSMHRYLSRMTSGAGIFAKCFARR
jgi:hypothetical protein